MGHICGAFKWGGSHSCHSSTKPMMATQSWHLCWFSASRPTSGGKQQDTVMLVWLTQGLLLFSLSVVSDSLWPPGTATRQAPSPSLFPGVYSNSCPLSQWCHPTILSSVILFFSCLQSFPASGSFPMSWLCIRWPKYWNFSFGISPSNKYSELISFRIDWFDLAVQETLKTQG